jgi:hypothetical protein
MIVRLARVSDDLIGLKVGGEEEAWFLHHVSNVPAAEMDELRRQMSEDGLSEHIVWPDFKPVELEAVRNKESWLSLGQKDWIEFLFEAGLYQALLFVDPKIMAGVQIRNKVHSTPQASTSNVQQEMVRS